jgi:hypothetical protein
VDIRVSKPRTSEPLPIKAALNCKSGEVILRSGFTASIKNSRLRSIPGTKTAIIAYYPGIRV